MVELSPVLVFIVMGINGHLFVEFHGVMVGLS